MFIHAYTFSSFFFLQKENTIETGLMFSPNYGVGMKQMLYMDWIWFVQCQEFKIMVSGIKAGINLGILQASLCNSLTKLFLSPLSINWKTYNLWRNIFTIITEKYIILKVNPFLQPSLCWCGVFFLSNIQYHNCNIQCLWWKMYICLD